MKHSRSILSGKPLAFAAALLLAGLTFLGAPSQAATFTFNTDPFAGSDALTTPGRQVVQGGEPSIAFNPASDVLAFDPGVYGFANDIRYKGAPVAEIPSGTNAIVLQTLDNDNNPATPFGAGNAATLIANQVSSPGAGVFIYFNSALSLNRLVFSTNLDDPTADLAVLARFSNQAGQAGIDALTTYRAGNFTATPEPSTLLLTGSIMLGVGVLRIRSQRRKLTS